MQHNRLITCWQALEYIASQNLDRRAFAALNCITGAVGAWRRELLECAGGSATDTLAEDQDLTLMAWQMGYEIGYEENAIAWAEEPDTLKGLAKQRFRWSFGMLQCTWKHRDVFFRARYVVALQPGTNIALINITSVKKLYEKLRKGAKLCWNQPKRTLLLRSTILTPTLKWRSRNLNAEAST